MIEFKPVPGGAAEAPLEDEAEEEDLVMAPA